MATWNDDQILPTSVGYRFAAAVPSDATVLTGVRQVICSTSGNLIVKGTDGTQATIGAIAGQTYWISPVNIMAASTGTYVLVY